MRLYIITVASLTFTINPGIMAIKFQRVHMKP